MYAIVKASGRQYKVKEGDEIYIEGTEAAPGDKVELDDVVMVKLNDEIVVDKKKLSGVKVEGEVLEEVKGKKVIVFKYKPKKNYRRKKGHRSRLLKVKIGKIKVKA